MKDLDTKAKKAVLEEIMSLMDERESDGLKSKSPKFAKAEEPIVEEETEESAPSIESEDMDDEDKARLKELYEKHC